MRKQKILIPLIILIFIGVVIFTWYLGKEDGHRITATPREIEEDILSLNNI